MDKLKNLMLFTIYKRLCLPHGGRVTPFSCVTPNIMQPSHACIPSPALPQSTVAAHISLPYRGRTASGSNPSLAPHPADHQQICGYEGKGNRFLCLRLTTPFAAFFERDLLAHASNAGGCCFIPINAPAAQGNQIPCAAGVFSHWQMCGRKECHRFLALRRYPVRAAANAAQPTPKAAATGNGSPV